MERRVLLAITLSFLVLFLYQWLFVPVRPPQAVPAPGTVVETPPPAVDRPAPGNITAAAPSLPEITEAPSLVGDPEDRDIVVETQTVRAVFTNRGARVREWVLKQYRDDAGEPLNLVPETLPPALARPFALRLDDPAATARVNDMLFRSTVTSGTVEAVAGDGVLTPVNGEVIDGTTQPVTITFEAETADGLRARKVFTFEPDSFVLTFSASVQHGAETLNPAVEWGAGMGDDIARSQPGSFLSPNYLYRAQAIYHTDGDVEREAATALGVGAVREGQFRWAGIDDHYFISAVLAPPAPTRLEYQGVIVPGLTVAAEAGHYVAYTVRFPEPPQNVRFYIGPKQLDVLRSIDPEFTRAIYFGIFAFLAAPLLDALRWVYGYVQDWGWSIVVLTILINLAMFPLRHKSVVSMRRMQELQPQMKAIQERYAKYKITDPERQKMNAEVMDLYRSKGVNPASGCVPMLLTMPFLFSFYAMLSQAIEIRGEEFLWWISDLSRSDPFYITPALMGVTMFWQQRITPTTADPTQQKIMMFMPFMITFMMLFAPSGLVIYWLVSNVWAIGQQYFTNWMIGPPRIAGLAPKPVKSLKPVKEMAVAERRAKK
jgi:YidC/Oxa1 family membrane protein insertase